MSRPGRGVLLELGDERFVSLTTFRRSGEPVPTPVWVARDGDALVVTTPAGSGKVTRLRHTSRVELRACGRTGSVAEDAPVAHGTAEVLDRDRAELFAAKYRWEYYLVMLVERLARRRTTRVQVRITPAGDAAEPSAGRAAGG